MHSFEIEQKYRCASLAAFRSVLRAQRARLIKKGSELNEFWDMNGRLAKKKTVLRLRRHGNTAELTVKGPRLKSRFTKRIELQTPVEFAQARAILEALGFKLARYYTKKREVYECAGVTVTLDTLPKLGTFVELEGSVKNIKRAEKKFGLSARDREERSYSQMLFSWRD